MLLNVYCIELNPVTDNLFYDSMNETAREEIIFSAYVAYIPFIFQRTWPTLVRTASSNEHIPYITLLYMKSLSVKTVY